MIHLMRSLGGAIALLTITASAPQPMQPLYMGMRATTQLAQAQLKPGAGQAPVVGTPPAAPEAAKQSESPVKEGAPETSAASAPGTPGAPSSGPEIYRIPIIGRQAAGALSGGSAPGDMNVVPQSASPEVRKAEAELDLAEAEQNKVSQDVARDVALAHQKLKRAQGDEKFTKSNVDKGLVPSTDLEEKASSSAAMETELRCLLGISLPVKKDGKLEFEALPERLEDMISLALGKNADIKQAAAKVNLARVNVESVQQRVSQDAVANSSKAAGLGKAIKETSRRVAAGLEGGDRLIVLRAQAEEAAQAAEQLGLFQQASEFRAFAPDKNSMGNAPAKRPDIPEELQEKLDQEFSGEFVSAGDKSLRELLDSMGSAFGGLNFVLDIEVDSDEKLTVKMENMSIKNMLLALTDQIDGICFVIRDYGILVTTMQRAVTMNAPTIPADVPLSLRSR